jgi:L-asparagine oxygenase
MSTDKSTVRTTPVSRESLEPLREGGMSGLAALLVRVDAGVWFEDRWLSEGSEDSPVVVFEGVEPAPVVAPQRRALVLEQIIEPVDCIDPADPLVLAPKVNVHGVGAFAGLSFLFPSAGRVSRGVPVAELRAVPVVSVEGPHVRVAGSGFLRDAFLGAEDNAHLLVRALVGSPEGFEGFGELVSSVHLHRAESRAHRRPPVLDLSEEVWDFEGVPASGSDLSDPEFARAMRRNVRRLPERLFDALLEFADDGNETGALLLRGFPVGDLPPTPPSPSTPFAKELRSELTLLTVGRLLGQPVGYLPENNGNVVQNIVPTREGADRQVSTSSSVNLAWHTEAAFHPHRPRFLLLFCLRGDPAARTTLCSVREVVDSLPLRTRALLASPLFRTRADESYVRASARPLGRLTPVLGGDMSRPTLVFDADLMVGQSRAAQEALDQLVAAIEASHTSVVLTPGDLLVVDNTVSVHGRSPFTPRFDGTDRWLQRTFVVPDLVSSASARTGRVVRTRFSAG